MQRHTNEFMIANARKIEAIKRQLLEHSYAGSYGGSINLAAVNNMLDGCIVEITKLQRRVEELEAERQA
jgi:hypothetical protein